MDKTTVSNCIMRNIVSRTHVDGHPSLRISWNDFADGNGTGTQSGHSAIHNARFRGRTIQPKGEISCTVYVDIFKNDAMRIPHRDSRIDLIAYRCLHWRNCITATGIACMLERNSIENNVMSAFCDLQHLWSAR